jgi:hypothetical protein
MPMAMAAAHAGAETWAALASVRAKNVLVQCITNYVSMDLAANTLLVGPVGLAKAGSTFLRREFDLSLQITAASELDDSHDCIVADGCHVGKFQLLQLVQQD